MTRRPPLVGCSILARSEDLPPEWENTDDRDIAGFAVFDTARGDLGVVCETIVTGANDVWVVEATVGQVLVPVIDDVILDVDEIDRMISVAFAAGLIDEDD